MADDLEARLASHAQAFEGLLSLIPAKEYYAQDNSDQWQRKKQTKEQKRQAKRAKLDPSNQKSAKDIMDENERKRKRELGIESDQDESVTQIDLPVDSEKPLEGLRKNKKQKVDAPAGDDAQSSDDDDDSAPKNAKVDKRKEKRRIKKEKAEKQKLKQEAKKARKQAGQTAEDSDADSDDEDAQSVDQSAQIDPMDISGLADNDNEVPAESSSEPVSPVFDNSANQSAGSSASSIVPPAAANGEAPLNKPKREKALKLPEVDAEELQARLKARIEQLRAQRKADGPAGNAPRSRQELLESRRKKEEARKQHKKELRLKAKQEEERKNNERLRGSGSPLSTDIFSPRPIDENNFSFGRVAFDEGVEADPTLGSITEHKRKKGPQDTRTALIAAEKKAQRLAGYDEEKRAEIEEKDMWLNAKKRAHGERVRDDQNLLKKALKRKEKAKTKSATEWNERIDNVAKGKEMKDKRREENLKKRRDEKGTKKGKKGGSKGGAKKKGRPGFEGRFKA